MPEIEWIPNQDKVTRSCGKLSVGEEVFQLFSLDSDVFVRIAGSESKDDILTLNLCDFYAQKAPNERVVKVVGHLKKVCISSIEP